MGYKQKSPLLIAQGGTGTSSVTAYSLVVGNGTSAISFPSIGSSGQILVANGASSDPTFQATAVGTNCIVTPYTSAASGNHTLNANTHLVEVYLVGAGGGGGGGKSSATVRAGGGGGGGGMNYCIAPVAFFGGAGASVAYSLGNGGDGGNGVTSPTVGNDGTRGQDTIFGNMAALGGGPGLSGDNNGNGGGNAASYYGPILNGTNSRSGGGGQVAGNNGTSVATPSDPGILLPTAGGGGAGAQVAFNGKGGDGGLIQDATGTIVVAAATGIVSAQGSNGTNPTVANIGFMGGTGGAGGGTTGITAAFNGGSGGFPGGGGGGGAGSVAAVASGSGGQGGNGAIYVVEYI